MLLLEFPEFSINIEGSTKVSLPLFMSILKTNLRLLLFYRVLFLQTRQTVAGHTVFLWNISGEM